MQTSQTDPKTRTADYHPYANGRPAKQCHFPARWCFGVFVADTNFIGRFKRWKCVSGFSTTNSFNTSINVWNVFFLNTENYKSGGK